MRKVKKVTVRAVDKLAAAAAAIETEEDMDSVCAALLKADQATKRAARKAAQEMNMKKVGAAVDLHRFLQHVMHRALVRWMEVRAAG